VIVVPQQEFAVLVAKVGTENMERIDNFPIHFERLNGLTFVVPAILHHH